MTIPKRLLPPYLVSRYHHKAYLRSEGRVCRIEQLEDRRLLAINQPPVNDVPGPQATQVNTPLAFNEFRSNLLGVSDPDAGINKLLVTLTATHGDISFVLDTDPNGGLTYSVGDGTEDVTMTFTGTQANINEAFQWIVFNPESDYIGTEAGITLTTNDQGFVGTGGPKEDIDFIPITVNAVPEFAPAPTYETLPAALDSTFDGDGIQILSISAGVDFIHQMLPLSDGRILAVGAVNDHFGLIRFLPDLTLDPTFGTGGVVENDFGAGKHAYTVTIHPEGSLLVGGQDYFAKYSFDGMLDMTFGVDGKVLSTHANSVKAIAVQADGKIVVTGDSSSNKFAVSRYLADGSADTNFGGPSWGFDFHFGLNYSRGLHLRDDGRLVLTGSADNNVSIYRAFGAVRINVFAGTEQVFKSFTGRYNHDSLSSFLLPDGKLLQVGRLIDDIAILRLNADGSVDSTFGTGGLTSLPVLNGVDVGYRARLQADGKILIAGHAHNGANNDFAVVRLNYDGSLDPTFISSGSSALGIDLGVGQEYAYDVVSLPDGKILLAGRAGDDIALVRLLGDSDIVSPTAALALPTDGCSIDIEALNGLGYLNVTFADVGGSGLDLDSVTDVENELILSGTAAAGVTLDGTAALVSGSTYQYTFTGTFGAGPVSVEFDAGTFADQYGNANESAMASFTVVNQSQSVSGDFDQDCHVDGRDFLAWQRGFGLLAPNATRADGDANNDTAVDDADLTIWEGQYGLAEPLAALGALAAGESASIEPAPLGIAASEASSPVIASSPSNTDLVDVALAVALKEEADTVFGKREFVEQASPLEYFSAEPIGRADLRPSFSIAGKPASSATSTQEGESPETPSSWEEAFDEVFASVL